MTWGTVRQHSVGATWENSPPTVHDDRILGFIPSFHRRSASARTSSVNSANVATSGYDPAALHATARRSQSHKHPRGGQFQPSLSSGGGGRPSRGTRPFTIDPPASIPMRASTTRAPHRSMYDDPAFSADPTAHPHFVSGESLNSSRRNPAASNKVQPTPAIHVSEMRPRDREPATVYRMVSNADDLSDDDNPFELLHPPPFHNTSSNSVLTSSYGTSTAPSSTNSHSSSGHSSSSIPFKQTLSGPVNRAPEPIMGRTPPAYPPTYEESITPDADSEGELEGGRPSAPRGISSPELHQPPLPPVQLARSNTAPPPDADNHPQRKDNRSNAQRMRDLDKIDELDETDPFGSGMHHRGPYEAISAILAGPQSTATDGTGRVPLPKKAKVKKPVQTVTFPGGLNYDPYAPLNLAPGQILPRAPMVDARTLDQTPYHRQHRSASGPAHPPGVEPPSRRHRDRTPHHPPQPAVQYEQFAPRLPGSPHVQFTQDTLPPRPQLSQLQSPPPPQPQELPERNVQFAPQSQPPPAQLSQLRSPPPPQPQSLLSRLTPAPPPTQHRTHAPPPPPPPQPSQSQIQESRPPPPQVQTSAQPRVEESRPPPQRNEPQIQSQTQYPQQSYLQVPPHHQPQPQPQAPPHAQHQSRPRPESQPNPPRPPPTHSQDNRLDSFVADRTSHQPASSRTRSMTSGASIYSSNHTSGPVPLHIPRRLVMPTPLQQPNNALPQYPSAQQPPYQQRQQSPPRAPQTSQVKFHDPNSYSDHGHQQQPRAADISMTPDGKKLLRKRTSSQPAPVRVPLNDQPPPDIPSKLGGFGFGFFGKEQVQPPPSSGPPPVRVKDKSSRRLSKRRNDI